MPFSNDVQWAEYNDRQVSRKVRPLCTEVMTLAGPGRDRVAVDLGCGAGIETRALMASGWRVHAIDGEPGTPQRVARTAGSAESPNLTVEVADLETVAALPTADLVYAGLSLPFVAPDRFPRLWSLVVDAIVRDGWFAGHFFGARDSWAGSPGMTFCTASETRDMLGEFDVVRFHERDEDGMSFSGPKHWHVFDVIARRCESPR